MRGKRNADGVDRLIAALAGQQHGIVARRQLLDSGVGRNAIDRRLNRRLLHGIHRGVYAVGHTALTADGRWMAAVLAGGPGSVLSHRSAAALWCIWRSGLVDVTVRRQNRPARSISFHRASLPPDEVTTERGIPITTVPRTLLDLATVLKPPQVERAINEAQVRGLTDLLSLPALLERYPGRPGTPNIRAVLARLQAGSTLTRSELELRFLEFVRAAELPPPELNASLQISGNWLECDCLWRPQRLIVELDGHAFHATPAAFERDRVRDRRLHAVGWRTVRVTWQQLQADTQALADDLRTIVGRPAL
jgi:hypothetical protein